MSRREVPRTKKEKVAENKQEDVLADVLKMFKSSWDYTKKLHPIWERDIKLYNNERVQKNYEGLADTFVPMTFSTIETIKSALTNGDLSIKYQPQDIYKYLTTKLTKGMEFSDETARTQFLVEKINEVLQGGVIGDDDLDVLNALSAYYWDIGGFDEAVENLVDSGLKIGQGSIWIVWDVDHPKAVYVPFRDFIFDTSATCDDEMGYMGRRYHSTIKKLEDIKVIDPQTRELIPRYSLDELKNASLDDTFDKTDKQEKEEMLIGAVNEKDKDIIEIIEIVTEDKAYTIANRKYVIENTKNWFKAQAELMGIEMKGIIPGVTWSNYKDPSLIIGKSETSTFWKEQERLNDTTNQKGDAITRSLLQHHRIDPKYQAQAKALSIPGAAIIAPDGAVDVLPQAQTPAAAFNEEVSIKNNIRETTATDQIVKGVGSSQDVTATEANLQVANADSRIKSKIKSLKRGPLTRIAKINYDLIRLFVTDMMIVPIETNKGIQGKLYDPTKYTHNFYPKVQLTINANAAQQKDREQALATYQILIQDPTNDLQALKEIYLPKITTDLDKSELDSIIKSPNQAMQPMGMPAEMPV